MRRVFLLLAVIPLLIPRLANAIAVCTASATSVAFGVYDPTAVGNRQTTGTITVSCDLVGGLALLVSYTISLSTGNGTYAPRVMRNAALFGLQYNLYTSNAFSQVWGNGSGGTGTISDGYLLGLSVVRNYTVHGRIAALQNAAAGAYSDSIVVTISY